MGASCMRKSMTTRYCDTYYKKNDEYMAQIKIIQKLDKSIVEKHIGCNTQKVFGAGEGKIYQKINELFS